MPRATVCRDRGSFDSDLQWCNSDWDYRSTRSRASTSQVEIPCRARPFAGTVVRLIQTFNGVIRIGTIDPLVAVHPQAKLKFHAARDRLLADELQHPQIRSE